MNFVLNKFVSNQQFYASHKQELIHLEKLHKVYYTYITAFLFNVI
jgi:hypothetical protein